MIFRREMGQLEMIRGKKKYLWLDMWVGVLGKRVQVKRMQKCEADYLYFDSSPTIWYLDYSLKLLFLSTQSGHSEWARWGSWNEYGLSLHEIMIQESNFKFKIHYYLSMNHCEKSVSSFSLSSSISKIEIIVSNGGLGQITILHRTWDYDWLYFMYN